MGLNILADFHHSDLFWSLYLLSNRLGVTLYRPYGMDWYDQGYYKLYGNLRARDPERWIAKQYLVDTLFNVSERIEDFGSRGWGRESYNGCEDYPAFNLLTLDDIKNKRVEIDIVICSVHENEPYFTKLREFYPNAKFIRQVGNDLDTIIDEVSYPNLLSSATAPYSAFQGPNKVIYKQEFDLNIFKPEAPQNLRNLWSFQNDIEQFEDTWEVWNGLKHKLDDFNFKSYGVGNDDGKIYPKKELVKKMLEATFILQSKGPWEGYGHIIHNAVYLGRPMIIKFSDYQGKIAEPLLIKDQTYLEMTDQDLVEKIRFHSKPEEYQKMYLKCREVGSEIINFDREWEEKLKPFFENLK